MSQAWTWPHCTFPGCDHKRTWRKLAEVTSAYQRHDSWVQGDKAICYCHGLEQGATFPCDVTQGMTASV
jgi:hypothetical protein